MPLLPNNCPKCLNLMERRYRTNKTKNKSYGYTEWDFCTNCKYIQHYECFKFQTVKSKKSLKKKKKNKKVPKMSYKQYMGSGYWKKRKMDYFSTHGGKKCEICGKKAGVTLHHKRYDVHFGEEPDTALVALCKKHHYEFHKNSELRTNMVKETDEYILTMKQLANSSIDDLSWID